MIPWVPLAMLAGKLFKSFSGPTSTPAADRCAAPAGYDFPAHMKQISAQTGLQLYSLEPTLASFMTYYEGVQYLAIMAYHNGQLILSVSNRISFPSAPVPAFIHPMIADTNRMFAEGHTSLCDYQNEANVIMESFPPPSGFTPEEFRKIADDMTCIIAAFDKVLARHGYR